MKRLYLSLELSEYLETLALLITGFDDFIFKNDIFQNWIGSVRQKNQILEWKVEEIAVFIWVFNCKFPF